METALDCIITIDHEGKVIEFNPAAERTFGYRRDQVVGREVVEELRGGEAIEVLREAGQPDPQPVVHARRVDRQEFLRAELDRLDVLRPPVGVASSSTHGHALMCDTRHRLSRVVVDADHGDLCARA